jgi:hypothetical protein
LAKASLHSPPTGCGYWIFPSIGHP